MYKTVSNTRAALMGLLFAMVGFSFALAVSTRQADLSADAGSRLVGSSPLRFTNPKLAGDRDLGDVAVGSSLVRYARATGGVRPYTFTSTVTPTLKDAISGSTATLTLFTDGMLSGSMGNIAIAKSPLRFNITVADAKGSNASSVTEFFRLTLDNSGLFKFAIDSLCDGIQYQPYVDILQVLNGTAPFTFAAGTVKVDGTATKTGALEDIGLSISVADGTVFGKPLVSGVLTFVATCTDAKKNQALSRAGLPGGQLVTVNLVANTIIASDIVTTGMTIKTGVAGKDSIKYAGVANLKGNKPSTLAGKVFVLKAGGYTTPNNSQTPATFDDKGKTTKPAKGAIPKGTKVPKLSASVNTNSQVKASISGETLATNGIPVPKGGTQALAVSLQLGDILVSSEVLNFVVKAGKTGATLTFKFSAADSLGGNFLLTSASGKDDKSTDADSWKVAFIATPPTGGTITRNINGVTSAVINVGSNFTDSITVSESKGKVKSTDKRSSKDAKVTKLAMDGVKGKGSMQTGPLPFTATGIHKGSSSSAPATGNTFPMNVDLTKGGVSQFFGEDALAIFKGTKAGWSSKLPK